MTIKFTKDHEYVRIEGETGTVGISDYAQAQLGDVVYVELPETGRALSQGDEAAVVESVKAASEVYAPVSGEVTEVNTSLPDATSRVNESPQSEGWFFKVKLSDASELDGLMDEAAYNDYVKSLG